MSQFFLVSKGKIVIMEGIIQMVYYQNKEWCYDWNTTTTSKQYLFIRHKILQETEHSQFNLIRFKFNSIKIKNGNKGYYKNRKMEEAQQEAKCL